MPRWQFWRFSSVFQAFFVVCKNSKKTKVWLFVFLFDICLLSLSNVLESGNVLDKLISSALVIDLAAIVLKPVTHDKPFHAKLDIVSANLLEDLLSNVDVGSFVLDNHQRLSALSEND